MPRRPHGIVVHRPRALLDLADVLDDPALRRAVRSAETERLFDPRAVEAVIAAHPGRATHSEL